MDKEKKVEPETEEEVQKQDPDDPTPEPQQTNADLLARIDAFEKSIGDKLDVVINGMQAVMASDASDDIADDEPEDVEPNISAEDVEDSLGIKD